MRKKIYSIINVKTTCWLLLGFCVLNACKKEAFMPQQEGTPLPYVDSVKLDVQTTLKGSAYKLFYAAWQRSHLESIVKERGAKIPFTLLVPDDAAMQAAGLDAAGISSHTPEQLDTLLMYHILADKLDPLGMQSQLSNVAYLTLLKHPQMMEHLNGPGNAVPSTIPYQYRQYIMLAKDGSMLINGIPAGINKSIPATNGILWPINRVLQKPERNMGDILNEDPRFSMLMAINHINDSIWAEVAMGMSQRLGMRDIMPDVENASQMNSFFAPTNEAFHNAGINSVAELVALNERAMPYFDWETYKMNGILPSDSILDYHGWGRMFAPVGGYGIGPTQVSVFYSNDLTNELLSGYALQLASQDLPSYYVPLNFMREGGTVKIQVKGSKATPATVTTSDINTFQGPLHIVDHLLIPDGFKLK